MGNRLQIRDSMTGSPLTIGSDIPMRKAEELMRSHRVRHLPVLYGGRIVGILSDRDVKLAAKFESAGTLPTEEFMTPDPYVVPVTAALADVVEEMAHRKIGSAVVVDESSSVVGIFTAVDALALMAKMLRLPMQQKAA